MATYMKCGNCGADTVSVVYVEPVVTPDGVGSDQRCPSCCDLDDLASFASVEDAIASDDVIDFDPGDGTDPTHES